ncbi:anaphase-promoting complex subunit 1 [Dendroctonus ponderosae]|uniref:anaphase-promoting complex subunit 1 n=1 Tax=Dendroctonus ponderosae TaxID=77166 RepID=UPI002034DB26|nr:anaphase-promoting complex subunit 1 [Dendroctonus ponderosae]
MIAASDPLEFIPCGRQQVARHPGPVETISKHTDFEDYLRNGMEKVSLSEDGTKEFWSLSKAKDDQFLPIVDNEEVPALKLNKTCKSNTFSSVSKHQMLSGVLLEETTSFKTTESSLYQKITSKRSLDASVRFPNKRFSSGTMDKRNDSKYSEDFSKSRGNSVSPEPSSPHTPINRVAIEDELYVKGQIAVWSRGVLSDNEHDNGRKVICCYSIPLPIKQALWATFYCERPTFEPNLTDLYSKIDKPCGVPNPAVCIIDSHHVRVFIVKGEHFVIPMPFPIEKVWSSKFGILIEKGLDNANYNENSSADNSGTLFSLAYPLDDVCPVAVSRNSAITKLTSTNYKVVYTSENPSICLIFDKQTKEHSVYKIRKVKCDERDYGDNQSGCHSVAFNSNRLKSKLSMWENLMTSGSIVTPSPISTNKQASSDKHLNTHKSKSFSSMATISRCQSPGNMDMDSPWVNQSSKKSIINRSTTQNPDSLLSKSYFNSSKCMSHLRSNPNICLEYLWTDTYSVQDTLTGSPATTVFLTEDFVGQWYLCYVLPSRFQLSIVKIDFSGSHISFGVLTSISAKDAIELPQLHMLAILEHNGNVTLYSGLTMVGKLHINGTLLQHTPMPPAGRQNEVSPFPRRSSLLPMSRQAEPKFDEHLLSPVLPSYSQNQEYILPAGGHPTPLRYRFQDRAGKKAVLVGLIDSVENRLTLKYSNGTFYRITLSVITYSELIECCLVALKQCLPRDAALVLACRWYSARHVIGSEDLDTTQEWDIFTSILFELLGYEDDQICDKPEIPAVKRQKTSPSSAVEDWSNLLSSDIEVRDIICEMFNLQVSPIVDKPPSSNTSKISVNPKGILFPHLRNIHFTLHLLYEDFKLNNLYGQCVLPLAKLLSQISINLGLRDYTLHYWKDFPKYVAVKGPKIDEALFKCFNVWQGISEKPVSVMAHIYKLLKGHNLLPYPHFMNVNGRSRDIVQLCGVLSQSNRDGSSEILLDSFIRELAQPMQDSSHVKHQKSNTVDCSLNEQVALLMVDMKIDTKYIETLPIGIYYLFYNTLWRCRENPPTDWPSEAYRLIWRDDLVAQAGRVAMENHKVLKAKIDFCFQLQETIPNTTKEIPHIDGMEDIDCNLTRMIFREDIRIMDARKMLDSSQPVTINLTQRPDVSDHDFIEEEEKHLYGICIRTLALPMGRGMLTLRTATPIITEPLAAPVLCLTGKAPAKGNTVKLSHIDTPANMNLWPLFHNGVANGLRITPDAQNIDSTWIIFNKPKSGADAQMEHAGFLMALGLNGHLKNLVVMSTFEYIENSHEMTSVGVLLGLSAAFRGTCNHYLSTLLAIHVEALLPPTTMELDISQNLQVAGLLGLGLLYQRSAHRHMTEVLLAEIGRPPGPEMENSVDRESYSLAAGLALGLVMLKHGDQPKGMSDLSVSDTLHYYMVGGNKRPVTGSQKDKYKTPSFQIREGSSVNLDLTAPGSTLALGLMYLGTGNKAVADWMAPPATQYLLDSVRPDFLMLRILSRSLILWDHIEPSKEWVIDQVPSSIRPYCMVTPTNTDDTDYESMNQAYCNIIAGACFGLGLKFAGSADQDAFETLLYFCHMFSSLAGKSIAELAGKPTIETCLNVLLLSASMVMAGTGNLEIMRLVRHLRCRIGIPNSAIVTYGSHLALHTALGLLFLGGGRYTLSNSPANVAALICAFYPKFPTHSNDNRYHFQAFRHLYVLAVEPRLVIPKDVISGKICYAALRLVKLDGKELTVKGPGLIPDVNSLRKVIVDDKRYWPVVFERGRNWDRLNKILSTTGCIEVKQRAGCLSYLKDKFGYQSDLARTLTNSTIVPWDPSFSSIIQFSSDESVKQFCETVLHFENANANPSEQKFVQLLTTSAYDAVVKDKHMVIAITISLLQIILNFDCQLNTLGLWQLKIIIQQVLSRQSIPNILSKEIILAMQQELMGKLESYEDSLKPNLQLYLTGGDFDPTLTQMASFITYLDLPSDLPRRLKTMNILEHAIHLKSQGFSTNLISKMIKILE